jgi:NADP-dependent 3-hydroxy acid dehydrogenase YdfG
MKKVLTGKTAIVSGSSGSGSIGFIRALLAQNATVIVPVNSNDELTLINRHVSDLLSGKLIIELTDLQDCDKMQYLIDTCCEKYGELDIALFGFDKQWAGASLSDLNFEEWERVMARFMNTFFVFGRIVLHKMREQKNGFFISLSDTDDLEPKPYSSLINVAAKARLEMAKVFANEVHEEEVRYHHLFVTNVNGFNKWKPGLNTYEMIATEAIQMYQRRDELNKVFYSLPGSEINLPEYEF